ncbi:hypothetical protein DPMN_191221 [Dreissena polymorpha]|uniref:Uncharacterized protein n=1 Tax=Dreissena polymorpha TaxID=45954 RepID=A0A9D4BDC9_DREPO|nr:hypothetical protein DPMN_191221 [Dreissena polymorpha]
MSLLQVLRRPWYRHRLSGSLLLVPRRSWHRRTLSWSLRQVPRQTIWFRRRQCESLLHGPRWS